MDVNLGPLIPITGILASVAFAWIALRYRQLSLENRRASADASQEAEEKTKLLARLAVLERIVTDRGVETAAQIDALREPRPSLKGEKVQ